MLMQGVYHSILYSNTDCIAAMNYYYSRHSMAYSCYLATVVDY